MDLSRRQVLAGIAAAPLVAALPEVAPERPRLIGFRETWTQVSDGGWMRYLISGENVLSAKYFPSPPFAVVGEMPKFVTTYYQIGVENFREMFGDA